jgi:tetratricopeptide (TPR) repeat protein
MSEPAGSGTAAPERGGEAAEPLVGRQRELASVRGALDSALAGRGCLVLISGEAGIGKSSLLEGVASESGLRNIVTIWATCWEGGSAPPYWPWSQVISDCWQAMGLTGTPGAGEGDSHLRALVGGGGSPSAPPFPAADEQLRLFQAVAGVVERVSRDAPLLVVLDDLHWGDASSLALLRFLASRLRRPPVAIVAAHRYPDLDPASPLAHALGDLVRLGRTCHLVGLGQNEVRELLRDITGRHPPERLVSAVHDRSQGNPLFVKEIGRLLPSQGEWPAGASERLPVPVSVRSLIVQRLDQVSDQCAQVLRQASVLGDELSVEVLRRLTGEPTGSVVQALDEAVPAGLLTAGSPGLGRRYRFTHGLIREVLYAELASPVRSELHRHAAEAIEELYGADLEPRLGEVAHHFWMAGDEVEPSRTLEYVRRAGDQALAMLAYAEAAAHYTRALELRPDADQQVELFLRAGDALLRAGEWDRGAAAFEQAAAGARRLGKPEHLARAAVGLGAGASGFEVRLFDQRQLDLLNEALDALDPADSSLRAHLLARLSVASTGVYPSERRAELSQKAITMARAVGDRGALAYALSSYCDTRAGPGHTEERLELATEMVRLGRETRNPETELLGHRFRLVALLELGDLTGVDAEIDAFSLGADRLHMPLYQWYVPLWRGMQAILQGRLSDAERLRAHARGLGQQAQSGNAAILVERQRVWWLVEAGRVADACALLESFVDDPESGPNAAGFLVPLLARVGRRAEAGALLARLAADDFAAVALEDTAAVAMLCFVADGAADLGDRNAGATLYRILHPYGHRFGVSGIGAVCVGSASRPLGRLTHLLGRFEEADRHFRHALAVHRRAGATLLIAHTLRDRAALLRTRGDREAAEKSLYEAVAAYRELGLETHVEAVAGDFSGARREERVLPATCNVFRRDGELWTLSYEGTEARAKDSAGMEVIRRLLAQPGMELHVLDLVSTPASAPAPGGAGPARPGPEGDAGEMLDAQARQEYKRRVAELEEEIDDARAKGDLGREEALSAEREFIVAELSAAYGLGGRIRRTHDRAERARTAVKKRLQSALDRLDRAHPSLARHLRNSIRTGRFCSYQPEQATTWEL